MASALDRQLGRVRSRLFFGSLLAAVAWGWVAALAVAVAWFLGQPYLLPEAPDWLRWAVLSGLAGVATLAALIVTALRAPTPVAAALSLDERFALKERVTTSLTLAPDEAASPAGQALLADVEQRLTQVRIGDRFPVRLPWKPAALLPVVALALACVVFFWNPRIDTVRAGQDNEIANPAAKQDVDKQMKQLAVKKREKKPAADVKPSDLARIDEDIDKFTRRPRETRDDIRDRIKDATELEEEIRKQQKEQAERMEAFREQMKQVERLRRKNRGENKENKDNPGKKAADALARGDMDKARDEFQRLADEMKKEEEKERLRRKKRDAKTEEERRQAEEELEKLERESKLNRKDKEDLQKQMEDLQDELERLTRGKDEIAKELKDLAEQGEIDKEELDRELEKLDKNSEKLSAEELKELAEAMKECKECMKKGDNEGAAKALEKASKAAGKMGGKEGEGEQLQQKLVQIQKVKKALCRALGNKPGGQPGGKRPEAPDRGNTATEDKYAPGQWNKGKREIVGEGPMGGYKGARKPAEMAEEIRQAAQEAPAAIERQRLPPSARKMARGYFEKVRGPDKANAPKNEPKKP